MSTTTTTTTKTEIRTVRRIAFFVEGRTEMHFVERLLKEVAQRGNIAIVKQEVTGGGKNSNVPVTWKTIDATYTATNEQFYALIVDCVGETNVKTRIAEEHKNLSARGYEVIVGIRDVRPDYDITTMHTLRRILRSGFRLDDGAPIVFILSVAEIEAWFLAEHSHFARLHANLTPQAISQALGFDPSVDDMSLRATPADDLHAVYQLEGRAYNKAKSKRTVAALDMDIVYAGLVDKIPELKKLVRVIDKFLTPTAIATASSVAPAPAAPTVVQ